MTALSIGSAEHKALFCRDFTTTFHEYEVRDVRWPDLDEADCPVSAMVKLGCERARGDILLVSNSEDTFAPRDVSKFLRSRSRSPIRGKFASFT